MSHWRYRLSPYLLIFTILLLVALPAWAAVHTAAHPTARVVQKVDNAQRTTLPNHVPPMIQAAQDLGRMDGNTQLDHMVLVLRRSVEQEHSLIQLLDEQQNSKHANYHQWMTPAEFGAAFGAAEADIAKVTEWLGQQGLTVEQVAPGNSLIFFNGKASLVEQAFGTEFHTYLVNGETHVSASADPSVPTALATVISALPTLHNFFKKPYLSKPTTITGNVATGQYTSGGGTHYFGPQDFATIYNTNPLLQAGTDGTGVTIGVVARTDINLADVQVYREMFNLKRNDPVFVIAGQDPGVVPGDDTESYLDAEVSGGVAPGATVKFVAARSTAMNDGVDLSAAYLVLNNAADIITESYGSCEYWNYYNLGYQNYIWEQAAAQGITVFVSSADNGPAGCDSANNSYSGYGYAVNALAATPFNVAVGGTQFSENGLTSYWSSTNAAGWSSAQSYIPEVPWNESRANGGSGLWSGSGGVSSYFTRPSWQRGPSIPTLDPAYPNGFKSLPSSPYTSGPHRLLPDVSLNAASGHDGTLYCAEGVCKLSSTGALSGAGVVGGTSVAAPEMAGVQALVNQANGGGRQGMTGYIYYTLAINQNTASCASSSVPLAIPASSCVFNDVTTGSNVVCGDAGCTTANKLGWTATAGYDLATGLGSVNTYNLATQWNSVTFTNSLTGLQLSQTTGIAHGDTVTFTVNVTPGTGSNVPTGDVAFFTDSGMMLADFCTLTNGSCVVDVNDLPAGTYNVWARYAGDANFGASTSLPTPVTVGNESSSVSISIYNNTWSYATTFPYGAFVSINMSVISPSGWGFATGSFNVTDNGAAFATLPLNPYGAADIAAGAPLPSGYSGYLFTNTAPFPVGTHALAVNYSGDSNFTAGTGSITITITQATPSITTNSKLSYITTGQSVTLTATVAGASGAAVPTGTVTFTAGGTTLGTATLNSSGLATLTTTGITTSGANSVVATYSGDGNYVASSGSPLTVTVGTGTATTVAITSSANPAVLLGRPTITATVTPSTATGTVAFWDGSVQLGTATLNASGVASLTTPSTLLAGSHPITANYQGNATYAGASSGTLNQTISKITPTAQLTVENAGNYNQTYTLSAALGNVSTSVPPVGTIQFYDGVTALGAPQSLQVVTSQYAIYRATLATSALQSGSHTITAQFSGDTNYAAAYSNPQVISVNQLTPVLAWPAPAAITYPATIATALTATASYSGATVPGTFTYTADGSPVTGATILQGGTHSLVATFTPTDKTNYIAGGTVAATLTVNKAGVTIGVAQTAPASSATYGQTVTVQATVTPTAVAGPLAFAMDSGASTSVAVSSGTATTTYPLLTGGAHSLSVNWAGDTNYSAATGTLSLTILPYTGKAVVVSSLPSAGSGQSITFTATVTGLTGGATPTGTVQFKDGTAVLGSGTVNASGVATYTTATLTTVGAHTITAVYSGDANYGTVTSTAITQTIIAPDYTLAASPSSGTIGRGDTFTSTITATSVGGYTGTITPSCGTLPQYMTCSFTPMAWSNGTATSTLKITTAQAALAQVRYGVERWAMFALLLPGLLLAGNRKQARRRMLSVLLLMVIVVMMFGFVACGGGSSTHSVQPGSYTVPVTVTGGSASHVVNITVTVK